MLKGLGARVIEIEAPFDPEGGAYAAGHGHAPESHAAHDHSSHAHEHDEHCGHDHHHGHSHAHDHK
jgi:urease accessory protein